MGQLYNGHFKTVEKVGMLHHKANFLKIFYKKLLKYFIIKMLDILEKEDLFHL
jgi:hypothetical protein